MKTDEILNLDCTIDKNKTKLNRFLYNIKPIKKIMGEDKTKTVGIDVLENVLHGMSIKYGYKVQHMFPYYEDEKFIFYNSSIIKCREKTNEWIGNAYGKTMWEVLAKTIIKIYADIMEERKEK